MPAVRYALEFSYFKHSTGPCIWPKFLSANPIAWFFYIKHKEWYGLLPSFFEWQFTIMIKKPTELILVTGGFCDSLRVSLEVKLVSFEFIQ